MKEKNGAEWGGGMSWIVVRKSDGQAVAELYCRNSLQRVDRALYDVQTAMQYLCAMSAKLRAAG